MPVNNRTQSLPVQKDLTVTEAGSLNLVFNCCFSTGSLKLQCKKIENYCIIANLFSKGQKTRKPYLVLNPSHLEAVSPLQEATSMFCYPRNCIKLKHSISTRQVILFNLDLLPFKSKKISS